MWLRLVLATAVVGSANPLSASGAVGEGEGQHWIGTWATAAQPAGPANAQTFRNQTLPLHAPNRDRHSRGHLCWLRQLIARAHKKGIRVIGTTIPPFEGATFVAFGLDLTLSTPEREKARQAVNEWIRHSGTFDAVVDFDEAVRDPARPTQLRPSYAASDHLHVKDDGNVAQGNAIPLALFRGRRPAGS